MLPREDATIYQRTLEESLRELGYVIGQNLVMEYRVGDSLERIPDLVAQLVDARVDVLVAGSNRTTAAAKQTTKTIPIVMVVVADPVGAGFVSSLARPGGNITGLAGDASIEVVGKELELLREVAPTAPRMAILRNPLVPGNTAYLKAIQDAGPKLGATLLSFDVKAVSELEPAFASMKRDRVGTLFVFTDTFTYAYRRQIAELAAKASLPTIAFLREFAEGDGKRVLRSVSDDGSVQAQYEFVK
jgi:putative ABC transport system substrate-binding protein